MIRDIIRKIFFPEDIKCIICDAELDCKTRFGLCDKCSFDYNTKFCSHCGRNIGENHANFCLGCMNSKSTYYDIARAPVVFSNNAVHIIHKLKYGGTKYLVPYIAEYMYSCFLENNLSVDYVTCVPMHVKRKRERGYNQAELIAKQLCKVANLQYVDTLNRVKYTTNLARMNKQSRNEAISGVFEYCSSVDLKNKKVLLIDDVFTSGSTTDECARILKSKKVASVVVLTFATAKEKPILY